MAVPGRSGNETGGNVSANGGSAADDGILAKLKELQVQRGDDGVLRVRLSPEQVLILAVPENGETGIFLVSSVEDNDDNLIFQRDVGALSGVGVDDVIGGGGNDGDSDVAMSGRSRPATILKFVIQPSQSVLLASLILPKSWVLWWRRATLCSRRIPRGPVAVAQNCRDLFD